MGKQDDWTPVNNLAKQYQLLVKQGYGTDINNRSIEQIKIINEIIHKTTPFLKKIAWEMLYGKGHIYNHNKKKRHISLKGAKTTIDDLISEGTIGLIKAFNRYDPKLGKTSTFIGYIAACSMYRSTIETCGMIRLPVNVSQETKSLRLKTLEEIADRYNDVNKIMSIYLSLNNYYINIHHKHKGDKLMFIEKLQKDNPDNKEETSHIDIEKFLVYLNPRERYILESLFGISKEKSMTSIGTEMGLTRERIRQIKNKALKKLKKRHSSNIPDYI